MQYTTQAERQVLEAFQRNGGRLHIFYHYQGIKNREMAHYNRAFADAFAEFLQKGVLKAVRTLNGRLVEYELKQTFVAQLASSKRRRPGIFHPAVPVVPVAARVAKPVAARATPGAGAGTVGGAGTGSVAATAAVRAQPAAVGPHNALVAGSRPGRLAGLHTGQPPALGGLVSLEDVAERQTLYVIPGHFYNLFTNDTRPPIEYIQLPCHEADDPGVVSQLLQKIEKFPAVFQGDFLREAAIFEREWARLAAQKPGTSRFLHQAAVLRSRLSMDFSSATRFLASLINVGSRSIMVV